MPCEFLESGFTNAAGSSHEDGHEVSWECGSNERVGRLDGREGNHRHRQSNIIMKTIFTSSWEKLVLFIEVKNQGR